MKDPMRVHLVRKIPASRQAVFEAWLDPERLAKFMKPVPSIVATVKKVDPRVGGGFDFMFVMGDAHMPHRGEYKVIDRFERLVFTWLSPHAGPQSVVTLTFAEAGPRSTMLTLDHVGLVDQESCDSHIQGWGQILDCLDRLMAA